MSENEPKRMWSTYGNQAHRRRCMVSTRSRGLVRGPNVQKLGKWGKHHRQVRDVTIDVECWGRIILDNQHEFPVLSNNYAWSCGIRVLNNQEFKPDYI